MRRRYVWLILVVYVFIGIISSIQGVVYGVQEDVDGGGSSEKIDMPETGDDTDQWNDILMDVGSSTGIHPVFLKAIMKHESGGSADLADSSCGPNASGDYGLMQINEHWWNDGNSLGIKKSEICDPEYNIWAGTQVLKSKLKLLDGYISRGTDPVGCESNPSDKMCDIETTKDIFHVLWAYNGYSLMSINENEYAPKINKIMKDYGFPGGTDTKVGMIFHEEGYMTLGEMRENKGATRAWVLGENTLSVSDGSKSDYREGNLVSTYDEYFNSMESKINNIGVDDRTSRDSKVGQFLFESWLTKVASFINAVAMGISILLIGAISILWLMAFLAYAGIDIVNEWVHKITFRRVDVGVEGFATLWTMTWWLLAISVIVVTGILPRIIALIYDTLAKIIEWLMLIG